MPLKCIYFLVPYRVYLLTVVSTPGDYRESKYKRQAEAQVRQHQSECSERGGEFCKKIFRSFITFLSEKPKD